MDAQRIAVMVDGDNISPSHSTRILVEAAKAGRVDVVRVYASAHQNSDWLTKPGFRVMHAGTGKNAADLLLCIDAMELALTAGIDGFVVASSDGDFTHLAHRLRERGLHVQGLGEEKAPQSFRVACSKFLILESNRQCASKAPAPKVQPPKAQPSKVQPPNSPDLCDLDRKIRTLIAQHGQKGRGMRIAELAPKLHSAHGTRISTLPERNWRAYLSKRPALYDLDPKGPEALVRFRPEGFAAG